MLTGGLVMAVATVGLALGLQAGRDGLPTVLPASGYEVVELDNDLKLPRGKAEGLRREALERAVLWLEPAPLEGLDLRHNLSDRFGGAEEVVCKFHPGNVSGTTPKFLCVFDGGEVLKVKYGENPEVRTEVAATRLLRALGAGADSVYLAKRLRCFGCPKDPQRMLRCISSAFEDWVRQCEPIYGKRTAAGGLEVRVDYGKYVDFETVAIERKREGKEIETEGVSGWGFDELDKIQGDRGRAERDALRLLAVFLNNWDTRTDNQRLVCLDKPALPDGRCRRPFAYMQDVGATFGRVGGPKEERKLDLAGWRAVPVWKDDASCRVKLDAPRFHGATLGEAVISEGGRRHLASRLRRLTARHVRALFEGARFTDPPGASVEEREVDEWVRAFQEKARQITARAPCPTP